MDECGIVSNSVSREESWCKTADGMQITNLLKSKLNACELLYTMTHFTTTSLNYIPFPLDRPCVSCDD